MMPIGKCFYCGEEASLCDEHVIPKGRGGPLFGINVVKACEPCNRHKSDRLASEWFQEDKRTDQRSLERVLELETRILAEMKRAPWSRRAAETEVKPVVFRLSKEDQALLSDLAELHPDDSKSMLVRRMIREFHRILFSRIRERDRIEHEVARLFRIPDKTPGYRTGRPLGKRFSASKRVAEKMRKDEIVKPIVRKAVPMSDIQEEIITTLTPVLRRYVAANTTAREPGFFLDLFLGLGIGAAIDDGLTDAQIVERVTEATKAYLAERAA